MTTQSDQGPAAGGGVGEAGGGYDPKAEAGSRKTPLRLLPRVALEEEAWAFAHGAKKYGAWNWREPGRRPKATVYAEAAMRHLLAWLDGEDLDEESGRSHLAHARAGLGILLDAKARGTMEDDRPLYKDYPGF